MNPPATPFNTLTCIDKGLHRQRRKILSHAFSEQALRSFEPVIIESVEVFLEQLRTLATGSLGQWSAAIDVAARLKYFTSDVISAFSFGDSFNTQRVEKNRGVLLGMRAGSMISGICNQYTWLTPFKNLLDRVLKPGGTWTREQYAIFMREVVKKRLGETKDARSDLFSFIIDAKDPETGAGLTMTEIWGESRMLMLAGAYQPTLPHFSSYAYRNRHHRNRAVWSALLSLSKYCLLQQACSRRPKHLFHRKRDPFWSKAD